MITQIQINPLLLVVHAAVYKAGADLVDFYLEPGEPLRLVADGEVLHMTAEIDAVSQGALAFSLSYDACLELLDVMAKRVGEVYVIAEGDTLMIMDDCNALELPATTLPWNGARRITPRGHEVSSIEVAGQQLKILSHLTRLFKAHITFSTREAPGVVGARIHGEHVRANVRFK